MASPLTFLLSIELTIQGNFVFSIWIGSLNYNRMVMWSFLIRHL